MYNLPHPLELLNSPISKLAFKKLVKTHVIDYWEQKLRSEADLLPSLVYFKPQFMSLTAPHPIWQTAGSNPYEVSKAIVQARMLSGRYRTELLCRHWSSNRPGWCLSGTCDQTEESLEHILIECPAYNHTRRKLLCIWLSESNEVVSQILRKIIFEESMEDQLHFLLDCSTMPCVIRATQHYGAQLLARLFHLART